MASRRSSVEIAHDPGRLRRAGCPHSGVVEPIFPDERRRRLPRFRRSFAIFERIRPACRPPYVQRMEMRGGCRRLFATVPYGYREQGTSANDGVRLPTGVPRPSLDGEDSDRQTSISGPTADLPKQTRHKSRHSRIDVGRPRRLGPTRHHRRSIGRRPASQRDPNLPGIWRTTATRPRSPPRHSPYTASHGDHGRP